MLVTAIYMGNMKIYADALLTISMLIYSFTFKIEKCRFTKCKAQSSQSIIKEYDDQNISLLNNLLPLDLLLFFICLIVNKVR